MPDNTTVKAVGSLRLKKSADRRLRSGHLWIYSNEVDVATTPLKTLSAGSEVVVEDATGKFVAMAVVNPASLICARLYSRDKSGHLGKPLIVNRLKQALQFRESYFSKPF